MKMMIGSTWKAKTTPKGPLLRAQLVAEDERAARLGVAEHGVDARADGLEQLAEIGLQHQEGEGELQAEAPRDNPQLDRAFVAGEEPRCSQNDNEPQQPGEPAH